MRREEWVMTKIIVNIRGSMGFGVVLFRLKDGNFYLLVIMGKL